MILCQTEHKIVFYQTVLFDLKSLLWKDISSSSKCSSNNNMFNCKLRLIYEGTSEFQVCILNDKKKLKFKEVYQW
jgi:hypothetical protein